MAKVLMHLCTPCVCLLNLFFQNKNKTKIGKNLKIRKKKLYFAYENNLKLQFAKETRCFWHKKIKNKKNEKKFIKIIRKDDFTVYVMLMLLSVATD